MNELSLAKGKRPTVMAGRPIGTAVPKLQLPRAASSGGVARPMAVGRCPGALQLVFDKADHGALLPLGTSRCCRGFNDLQFHLATTTSSEMDDLFRSNEPRRLGKDQRDFLELRIEAALVLQCNRIAEQPA